MAAAIKDPRTSERESVSQNGFHYECSTPYYIYKDITSAMSTIPIATLFFWPSFAK